MGERYFREIVLISVNLPYKPTYSLCEARKIFDCSVSTLQRMAVRGDITITKTKRIYVRDIVNCFSDCMKSKDCK